MARKKARKKATPKLPSMRLKKAAATRPVIFHPYVLRFGTRNESGEPRAFQTESMAREAIISELNVWKKWCERSNREGLTAIDEAKKRVESMIFHLDPQRIECNFDAYYDMWLCVEYWKTKAL